MPAPNVMSHGSSPTGGVETCVDDEQIVHFAQRDLTARSYTRRGGDFK